MTITATGTATSTNLVTNHAGIYATPALSIGNYQVSVEATGFNKWQGHLILRVAQTAVVDAKLTIAGVNQEVTVAGDVTPLVNTANQTIGSTLDRQRIQDLPENGRSVSNLVQLTYKLPDPESIQEVKVETSNSSAKFNRSHRIAASRFPQPSAGSRRGLLRPLARLPLPCRINLRHSNNHGQSLLAQHRHRL